MDNLNASVKIHRSNSNSTIFRIYPEFAIRLFKPGQYGSLGLISDFGNKLVKRAYSISSSIIDINTKELQNQRNLKFLEFYINQVPSNIKSNEQITPKLFKLKDGDRIYCGEKIVGHYIIKDQIKCENILLISTHTGESPNNSIVNQLLKNNFKINICNINVGKSNWESLYISEHILLQELYSNYKFIQFIDNSKRYNQLINFISTLLYNTMVSKQIGFRLESYSTLVMLCGDPIMIGAPIKKGSWNYVIPDYGLINILKQNSFELTTRFKEGNIIFESYWK